MECARRFAACCCAVGISGILSLALTGCSRPSSADASATDAPTTAETNAAVASGPKVIVARNDDALQKEIVVGAKIHVIEGFIGSGGDDLAEGYAKGLIVAMRAHSGDSIDQLRSWPAYRHYGGEGQSDEPSCVVVDQDPVDIHTSPPDHFDPDDTYNGLAAPLHCKLDDGRDMYVTIAD